MKCKCVVCRNREANDDGSRVERLRGFEIELSSYQIRKIGQETCKEHLKKCPPGKKCPKVGGADVACECDWCALEAGKGKKEECTGHPCVPDGNYPAYLTRVVKAAVAGMYPIEGRFEGHRSTPRDNAYWDLKTDSSCGFEMATPPLQGTQVEAVVGPVLANLQEEEKKHSIREFVDEKCGLHCTFDVMDVGTRGLKAILLAALRHQQAMVGTQPVYRKNNGNCRFLPWDKRAKMQVVKAKSQRVIGQDLEGYGEKYNFLNLQKVHTGRGLIEFRFGGATTNIKRLAAYGVLLECMVEAALRKPAVSAVTDEKQRLFEEIIKPYIKDKRVEEAWEGTLWPFLKKANL